MGRHLVVILCPLGTKALYTPIPSLPQIGKAWGWLEARTPSSLPLSAGVDYWSVTLTQFPCSLKIKK